MKNIHQSILSSSLDYRVDLDFVGLGGANLAYGGFLEAWSFMEISGRDWFSTFREEALAALGRTFLPIYRMADGEYRFLMGRRLNFHRRPLLKEILAVGAEKLRIKNPDRWVTSWGETYPPEFTRELRERLILRIREIAKYGFLGCFINDNGLNAFTEYNSVVPKYFRKEGIRFDSKNYVPFHFVPSLLICEGWEEFIVGRSILVITGGGPGRLERISLNLSNLGAKKIQCLEISATTSLMDRLELSQITETPDLCLVAAGIGAAEIVSQLKPLKTLVLDIGGLMSSFENPDLTQHGGVIGFPGRKSQNFY